MEPNPVTLFLFFFFNHPPTTEIYTLSLHDALPISRARGGGGGRRRPDRRSPRRSRPRALGRVPVALRSEEHTSELQSQFHLVCRLLLEKKNTRTATTRQSYNAPRSRAVTLAHCLPR